MIHQLKSINFGLPLVLLVLHQLSQKAFQIEIPLADNYLDPFCLGALAPHILCVEQHFFYRKKKLNILELVFLTHFLSIVSEIVFPRISDRFTADILDCFAIALGILWFVITSKKVEFSLFKL